MRLFFEKNACRKAEKVREERDDDLNKLLQFFRECKENNEHFYWDVDADPKTGVVRNIFWSHASQRAEYRDFGDVITFDTTHKTNSRRMPLAMFVGANNNLKNVTFGQALIGDESTGSFRWLFETFKSCMGGRQPHVILTGVPYFLSNTMIANFILSGCNISSFWIANCMCLTLSPPGLLCTTR